MSENVKLSINGRSLSAQKDATILDVAGEAGISIPTLCHDPRLDPVGACRSCLVEVTGGRRLVPACAQTKHKASA